MSLPVKCSVLLIIFLCHLPVLYGQVNNNYARILFYNVENLFDVEDDPETNDDEFTPGGDRHWNYYRLEKKLNNLAKVIVAAGQFEFPDIVGLAEVENRKVLERLISKTILQNSGYKIIHKESPDLRGIDVALLYDSKKIYPLKYKSIPLIDHDDVISSREILYFSCILQNSDTLHLLFNHWPSRYSGVLETVKLRGIAALILKNEIDSIFANQPQAKVIIMGDFNDQPNDDSILKVLNAIEVDTSKIENQQLYNLSALWDTKNKGTLKYQSLWYVFDQIIVSGSLLNLKEGLYCDTDGAKIYDPLFLFEEDKRYGGTKVFRTYVGFKYNGGFSDHLPVYLDIFNN